ncbi:MAG: TIGR02147 family protein [Sandaracinaceae bacterium]
MPKAAPTDGVDVYTYLDSRRYLEAHFTHTKKKRPGFSYRAFARLAKLKSPNYLKLVIDGKRNLSEEMAGRFAKACGLRGDRAAYFSALTRFTQASTPAERERAHRQLSDFLGYQRVHALEHTLGQYHSNWYVPAIRELAARADFVAEPGWVAKTLVPSITKSQAKKALDVLFDLELLALDDEGRVTRGKGSVTTGPQTQVVHMTRFHLEMMARAKQALETMNSEQREISSVTLCMGTEGLSRLKAATRVFRRELLALEQLEASPSQVIQVNLQVFPLSEPAAD